MAELTDKEITEACARAAGITLYAHLLGGFGYFDESGLREWNPLADRAQAMELAMKLMMEVDFFENSATINYAGGKSAPVEYVDENILRAICLCAARVQIEKEKSANEPSAV